MTNKQYDQMTKMASKKSKVLPDCLNAFWVGGLICVIGQLLLDLYQMAGLSKMQASSAVSISLVFLSILLTALTLYQKIANFAGAGTLVPITGFANAMAAPAIEFKTEGHVLGIGAKIFSIAGPVIVYGTFASWLYGLVLLAFKMF